MKICGLSGAGVFPQNTGGENCDRMTDTGVAFYLLKLPHLCIVVGVKLTCSQ